MRTKSFLILFLFPFLLHAQWTESFDGNTLNAWWHGQRTLWQVDQGQLRSNGPPVSGTCLVLSRAVTVADSFELQALSSLNMATSSNNYLSFILQGMDKQWRIKLGGTPDEVSLYEDDILVIDGLDKTVFSSSVNPIGIRLRVIHGWAELAICRNNDTLNWEVQGEAFLDDFSADSLLIEACYSSSNAQSFFIDDIRIGAIIYDKTPPKLLHHYLKDGLWNLIFSEPIDTGKVQIMELGKGIVPHVWRNEKELILPGLVNESTLVFQDMKDRNGNRILDSLLLLNDPLLPFRSLQITEFLADPSPRVGLPEVEWLELMNTSGMDIELADFQLMDASSEVVFPPYVLTNDGVLLLAANCEELMGFGPCLELNISSSFLNNAGDQILILHRNGDTLESVNYSSSWYEDDLKKNGGYSLEKRDPLNPCIEDALNFKESADLKGGSPGQKNSVDERIIDDKPPFLMDFTVLGPNSIRLIFSEELVHLGWALLEGDSLKLNPIQNKEYHIQLNKALKDDPIKIWVLLLQNQGDCSGNGAQDTSMTFRYALPQIPQRGDLIFTELLFLPSTSYVPFVEVYNRSEKALTLAGTSWGLKTSERALNNQLLYPGESLVFCKKTDSSAFGGLAKQTWSSLPSFSRSGRLWMKNVDGALIDAMYYADSFFMDGKANAGAYSLERVDSARLCGRTGDWRPGNMAGGTPGKPNFQTGSSDESLNELWQIYPLNPTQLRLTYSQALGEEPPSFQMNASGSLLDWQPWGTDFSTWVLTWSEAFLPYTNYQLIQEEGQACNGDMFPKQTAFFRLPDKAEGLRLNELLFDPVGEEPDYVELTNTGTSAIDLRGIFIGNMDISGRVQDKVEIVPEGYLLLPGDYVLITEKEHLLAKHYPKYHPKNTLLVQALPSFPNSGGGVLVFDSLGHVLDSFRYFPSMHSSLLESTEGVSLERIDPNLAGDQSSNWTSASASEHFGTPGYDNSQRRSKEKSQKHWELVSESFSPDGDGFEDQAILRFEGLLPGCHVTIEVHSLNGIFVSEWANNLPIGTEGQLLFEGMDSFGMPLPNGPYLLLITWTDPSGKKGTQRLVLVKASKY